jgi:Response regulator containing a CheY-like receiver domain and a GGDEF domain
MPETSPESAQIVLEKIRKTIAKAAFRFKEKPVSITISFGLAGFEKEDTVESVFERADKALYQAKEQGRNRCIIYDPSMASA